MAVGQTSSGAAARLAAETSPNRCSILMRRLAKWRVSGVFLDAQAQRDIIFELRRIAFDVECEPNNSGSIEKRKSMYTRDYKKLGFIVSSVH